MIDIDAQERSRKRSSRKSDGAPYPYLATWGTAWEMAL